MKIKALLPLVLILSLCACAAGGSAGTTQTSPDAETTQTEPSVQTQASSQTEPSGTAEGVRFEAPEGFPEGFKTPPISLEETGDIYALNGVVWQISDNEAWCAGKGTRAGGHDYPFVYHTIDRGESWTNLTIADVSAGAHALSQIRGAVTEIYVGKSGRGVITALEDRTADMGEPWVTCSMYATGDGGASWYNFLTGHGSGYYGGDFPIEDAYGADLAALFHADEIKTTDALRGALRSIGLETAEDGAWIVCTLEIDGKTVESRLQFDSAPLPGGCGF